MLKLRHIALSAFEIINDRGTILVDPFVSLNAQYNYRNSKNISDIFVTHGHYDHVGQTVEIVKTQGRMLPPLSTSRRISKLKEWKKFIP